MPAAVVPETAGRGAGALRTTATHCPYCSLQCGMAVTAGDRPATLVPLDFPTNRGGLCSKGWSSTELLDHSERLTRPLVRAVPGDRTSALVETSWDDQLGIDLETRFQGTESPAKIKMAVVGCPRNCAEAYVKDVGVVAVGNGKWEV